MFPIELITFHSRLATQQTNSTASLAFEFSRYPPVPVVVDLFPKFIFCDAFCAILHVFCIPLTRITLPSAAVEGRVSVSVPDDLFARTPSSATSERSAVTADQERPPVIVDHDKVPAPFVVSACPLVPFDSGNF